MPWGWGQHSGRPRLTVCWGLSRHSVRRHQGNDKKQSRTVGSDEAGTACPRCDFSNDVGPVLFDLGPPLLMGVEADSHISPPAWASALSCDSGTGRDHLRSCF